MIKRHRLLRKLLALLMVVYSTVGYAGPVQEAYQKVGNYDYIASGTGLRVVNGSTPPCAASTSDSSGTLSVTLPSGQSVDKAFLYWGGSRGSADTNVNLQVNGSAATVITATPHTTTFTADTISLPYYLSVADITNQLQGNGENLNVTVSGIDTDATIAYSDYCAAGAHLGIVVVHTTDNAITEPRAVLISHGLEWSRNSSISNTYSNLPPSATVADARATIWAVEGDAGLAGGESLSIGGNDQGVIWSQGDNNVGRSFETHQVIPSITESSNSLTWSASAGADLVLFPAFFTSWNVNPPIFTKSFSPLAIQTGETSTLTFSINNTLPGNITQTGILFTDLLPTNIELADSPNLQLSNCAAVMVTGPGGVSLAGGQGQVEVRDLTVNVNQTCNISLDVTSNAPNVGTPNACGGSSDDAWTNGMENITEASGLDVQVTDSCLSVSPIPVTDDYSDAPADGSTAPNGTSVTAYGDATHAIDSSLQLGATIDTDSASIASANADGDGADDDGVGTFGTLTDSNQTYSIAATVTNQKGITARLIAWIDFDGNGTFDPDEAAIRSIPTGTASSAITLNWSSIPLGTQTGNTFVRLRLTTDSMSNREPSGAKNDGEVEDYPITIVSAGVTVSGRVYVDANSNGNEESGESGISSTVVVLRDAATSTCQSVNTSGSGYYRFSGIAVSNYEIYQAHGDTTPVPQNCGVSFANNPTGYQSTTADTLGITVTNSDISGQNFGEVLGIRFEPNHQSEVLPGNVVFYTHVFSTEADGSVRFSTAESGNAVTGWTHTVYQDSNCNGTLDGVEGNTPITGASIGISEGGRLCLIDKVYAPSNVPARDRYDVKTTATFTYAGSTVAPATLNVTDVTIAGQTDTPATQTTSQVGESRLKLTKTVENLTQSTPETDTLNWANPRDVLKYRIHYRNTGTGPITDLELDDTVPAYTSFVDASNICGPEPTGMVCTASRNFDELSWGFTGSLVGGSEGYVSYEVRVDN